MQFIVPKIEKWVKLTEKTDQKKEENMKNECQTLSTNRYKRTVQQRPLTTGQAGQKQVKNKSRLLTSFTAQV